MIDYRQILSFLYGAVSLWMIYTQTQILRSQNELAKAQNILTESVRESGYSNELLNIVGQITDELSSSSYEFDSIERYELWDDFLRETDIIRVNPDTVNLRVSPMLEKRISIFTQSVKPYRELNSDGSISSSSYSPERQRLLKFLLSSYINTDKIFFHSDFSHVSLSNEQFRRISMRGLKLINSNIDSCLFYKCFAEATNFDKSRLTNVDFIKCNLIPSNYHGAYLENVSFEGSYLPYPIHFKGAKFEDVDFNKSLVPGVDWLRKMNEYFEEDLSDHYVMGTQPIDILYPDKVDEIRFFELHRISE